MKSSIVVLHLLLVWFPISSSAADYVLPIGVPDPVFYWGGSQNPISDSPPNRPATWDRELLGYYFVNFEIGTDSGRDYGTPSLPRKTIPRPIPAGSYVEVSGQYEYVQGGSQFVESEGTADNWVAGVSGPVWLTTDASSNGVFVGTKVILFGSYLYVFDANFHSGGRVQIGSGARGYTSQNIVVRDSTIEGVLESAGGVTLLSTGASTFDSVTNVLIIGNHALNSGDINSPNDDDAHIVNIGNKSSYVWVLENHLHTASGAGVQILGSEANHGISKVFVSKNNIHDVRQSGAWVKDGSDVVFSENDIHDIIDTPWSPSKCAGSQYRPDGLWIINNKLHNCRYGVRVPSTDGGGDWSVYIIGNQIYDIGLQDSADLRTSWEPAGIHIHGATNRYIENNLIYNAVGGIHFSGVGGSLRVRNNIITDLTSSTSAHLWVEIDKSAADIDFNVFGQERREPFIRWGTDNIGVNQFENITGQCSNCRVDNVLINTNLVPENRAALIDRGQETDLTTIFRAVFGVGIDIDILGSARKTGPEIDIGPYEFLRPIDTKQPLPPEIVIVDD